MRVENVQLHNRLLVIHKKITQITFSDAICFRYYTNGGQFYQQEFKSRTHTIINYVINIHFGV